MSLVSSSTCVSDTLYSINENDIDKSIGSKALRNPEMDIYMTNTNIFIYRFLRGSNVLVYNLTTVSIPILVGSIKPTEPCNSSGVGWLGH